jgi:hypothetical protein
MPGYVTPGVSGSYIQTPDSGPYSETVSVFAPGGMYTSPVRPDPYTTPASNPYITPAQPVNNPYVTTPAQPPADPYVTTPAQPAGNPYATTPANFSGSYVPTPGTYAQTTAPQEKEPGSKLILVVRTVVATALVLLVLGAGIFFLSKLRSSDAPEPTGPQQPQTAAPTAPSTQPAQPVPVATTAPQEEAEAPTEPTERKLPTDHPYYSCYDPNTEFVLPYSSTYYYAPTELANLSVKQ